MGWLILMGLFLITAFATYGIFANVAEARRENGLALDAAAVPAASGGGRLSASDAGGDERGRLSSKLTEALRAITASGTAASDWLQRTRVPYGHCTATTDCDKRTRCVQCDSFETTEEDVPALRRLMAQEQELAHWAEGRGWVREAEIHRALAAGIGRHLAQFEAATHAA